ncbi:MAG: hypothetical protein ACR2O3_04590 [Rhizobiaceae bacterium]
MRRNFSNKTFAIQAGPGLHGTIARRRALIWINTVLLIVFLGTGLAALTLSVSMNSNGFTAAKIAMQQQSNAENYRS